VICSYRRPAAACISSVMVVLPVWPESSTNTQSPLQKPRELSAKAFLDRPSTRQVELRDWYGCPFFTRNPRVKLEAPLTFSNSGRTDAFTGFPERLIAWQIRKGHPQLLIKVANGRIKGNDAAENAFCGVHVAVRAVSL